MCAEVGAGKSRTALAYYYIQECGGEVVINGKGKNRPMTKPRDIYVITTAKKRDSWDWQEEAGRFGITSDPTVNPNHVKMFVDSWNNIKKYKKVYGAFFIFDEQRVSGSGPWVKSFIDISRKNRWILLSATPGDKWMDYVPVFIANGYFRNRTQFCREHAIYRPFVKWKEVIGYRNEGVLNKYRAEITVKMPKDAETEQHHKSVLCFYDRQAYKRVFKDRYDIYDDCPIDSTPKLFVLIRKVVNSDPSRIEEVRRIMSKHKRLIIFYNFNYELEALRNLYESEGVEYAEWNGENHMDIPESDSWGYLVQYLAGCEGWNCILTDAMIFFSQNYSYRTMHQAEGRIDRLNTPYKDLYYYHLISDAPIDLAIRRALKEKREFNENKYLKTGAG